jgi:hypothetical protein
MHMHQESYINEAKNVLQRVLLTIFKKLEKLILGIKFNNSSSVEDFVH